MSWLGDADVTIPKTAKELETEQLDHWRQTATITPRQARLELIERELDDQLEQLLDGIDDDHERKIVKTEWEYATEIERSSPWVNTFYSALGFDQEGVDEFFKAALQR